MPDDVITAAEQQWAPPDHPVFELVPPVFDTFITWVNVQCGSPQVDFDHFWDIYKHLLKAAELFAPHTPGLLAVLAAHGNVQEGGEEQDMPLMDYERVGGFGQDGIPPAIIVEEILERLGISFINSERIALTVISVIS